VSFVQSAGSARSGGVAPSALRALTEIDQQQHRGAHVRAQLRRPGLAHVCDRCKRGDDQRHRRDDGFAPGALAPYCFHRQGILAHRYRDPERRAEFLAHGVHGGVQRGVLARFAAGRHPVGGEFDVRQRTNVGCQNVGERLAHGQPPGCGRIEHRDGRAFTHRHCFAGMAEVVGNRDGDVGHRHLPGPDHLVAADHAADGAVAD
jgi:hypothetical protein